MVAASVFVSGLTLLVMLQREPLAALAVAPLLVLGAILGWSLAESLLVLVNGGEDLAMLLEQQRAATRVLEDLVDITRRASAPHPERSPAPDTPPPVPAKASGAPPPNVPDRVRQQRRSENKCVDCGLPLNFARVSIEKKEQCAACETNAGAVGG
ncbi:hypothetical protein L6R52_21560 [Myxococcota bacterium]|nr:hypothetical protein [Myxococcota bacterium]